jgi:hypothetical protein
MHNRARYLMPFLAGALLAACGMAPATQSDTAGREAVIERERAKADLFFGSDPERRKALAWFADDYLNIAPDATGRTERTTRRELAEAVPKWPQFPPGTFLMGEMLVIPIVDGYVVSTLTSGPGPYGQNVTAWSTSVWARRDGEWKTVFYQLTPR